MINHVVHDIPPVYDATSNILILGSFPSVKSREGHFFYNHPQNRFWKVIAALYHQPVPETIEQKKTLLLNAHVAVWDVISQCDIEGSSDSSIKNVVPNDIGHILNTAPIERIYCNGAKSWQLYRKYILPITGIEAEKLPSTSPANAASSLERLIDAWQCIKIEEIKTNVREIKCQINVTE